MRRPMRSPKLTRTLAALTAAGLSLGGLGGAPIVLAGHTVSGAGAPVSQGEPPVRAPSHPVVDLEPEPAAAPSQASAVALVVEAEPPPERLEPLAHDHKIEAIRLRCEVVAGVGRAPHVRCGWSQSTSPRFAGYRLVRSDGEHREVVFRTRELGGTSFLDRAVEPGGALVYLVQVIHPSGGVIGASQPQAVRVPPRPLERIELGCARASIEGHRGVACRWGEATRDDVAGYVLLRAVDGGERTPIHRIGADGRRHHFDSPLRPGHRYTYTVVVLDADGETIGGSGAVTLGWPAEPPPPADPPAR